MRQTRRNGKRDGYQEIADLMEFDCGCPVPCLHDMNDSRLKAMFEEFRSQSMKMNPRKRENEFLLNFLLSPVTNTSIRWCDRALSALFTVGVPRIRKARLVVEEMCQSNMFADQERIIDEATTHGYHSSHRMNRFPQHLRNSIAQHLDLCLRPDPGASDGINICRLYNPDINTYSKLCDLLRSEVGAEDYDICLLYTSPSPRDLSTSRMPSSA